MHYRRHLLFSYDIKFSNDVIKYKTSMTITSIVPRAEHSIGQYLDRHSVWLGSIIRLGKTIETIYCFPLARTFQLQKKSLKKITPIITTLFICKKNKSGYFLNMFVMQQMFFEYFEFIFSALFECVKSI